MQRGMVGQSGHDTVKSVEVDTTDLGGTREDSGQDFETAPMEWEDWAGCVFSSLVITAKELAMRCLFFSLRGRGIGEVKTDHMKVFRDDG